MTRSPLYYPLNRGGDLDAGGAADLQTDIMRFMAILALCLVAIFALVQSIPLAPVITQSLTQSPPARVPADTATETVPAPVTEASVPASPPPTAQAERVRQTPPPIRLNTPTVTNPTPPAVEVPPPDADSVSVTPANAPVTAPAKEPAQALPAAADETAPAPASKSPVTPPDTGFTLGFESDAALTRLVARNEIGLYAISAKRSLRMSLNRGAYSFWPASAPNEFHEMDPDTVPRTVIAALQRSGALGLNPEVQWGVTLPTPMRRQLDTILQQHSGGALIIASDGQLRLEN